MTDSPAPLNNVGRQTQKKKKKKQTQKKKNRLKKKKTDSKESKNHKFEKFRHKSFVLGGFFSSKKLVPSFANLFLECNEPKTTTIDIHLDTQANCYTVSKKKSIVKMLNIYIMLSCTHLYHFFPVSIHYLQCIHCLLHQTLEIFFQIFLWILQATSCKTIGSYNIYHWVNIQGIHMSWGILTLRSLPFV